MRITDYKLKIVQVYAPTISYPEEDITNFYNGQIWDRNEKRKRRHLGRMGNIKKVNIHEYHVPEERREEMDVDNPKRCNENRN